jgi:hypothetical protein
LTESFVVSHVQFLFPLPQGLHQTTTEAKYNTSAALKPRRYAANRSYLPRGLVTNEEPIAVINRETAEYQQMRMEELVTSINIKDLVNKYNDLEAPKDPTRGNIHRFFGIAGCQNLGIAKTDKLVLDYCGVAMPCVLEGFEDPDVWHALRVGWLGDREIG